MNPPPSFRRRAWQGDLSLARACGLVYLLGGIALCTAIMVVVQRTDSIALGFLGLLAIVGWQVFSSVATWRAAARFTGPAPGAVLARAVVIGGNLLLAAGVATLVGIV